MTLGDWLKVKLVIHVLQPLLSHRSPARPWRPLRGFREYRWNDSRTLFTALFENGRIEVSAVSTGVFRIIVSFESIRKTPLYDGEYFTYAVVDKNELPLSLRDDGRRLLLAPEGAAGGLAVAVDRTTGRIGARDREGELFTEGLSAAAGDWISFAARPPRPALYLGFGQKSGGLFKNGGRYTMWNTDCSDMMKNSDPLYQSCPLAVILAESGSAGGLFFDNPHYARFTLPRRGRPGELRYRAARGPLALYLLGGPDLRGVVRQFTGLTGRYRLPPLWALGHHHSRWVANESAGRLAALAARFRERFVPLDALHIDIGHMRGYRCFTWDEARFPDPDGFLRNLRDRDIHPVVITDPGLKRDEEWEVYREGKAGGHFLKDKAGGVAHAPVWPGPSAFPDFGAAETARWWGGLFRAHTDKPVDGFWIDMNEPAVFTPRHTLPDSVVHAVEPGEAGGTLRRRDHSSLHNYYGFLMAKATAEGLDRLRPGRRTFLFTRSSYAGIQRFASSWTGDSKSRWDHLRLSLPMVMNLGLSGQVMTGPDIGGFWGAPTPELFTRFLEAAAFFPFHRNHTADGTPPQEIWAFGPEIEAIGAEYIRLRYSFLLYLYTALRQATVTGDPVCRPLAYDFPGDPSCLRTPVADSQYLCGGDLLVAPVLRRHQAAREVYFPKARADAPRTAPTEWIDYRTHEIRRGGTAETIDAPLGRLPLFVRRGAVLPLLLSAPGAFPSTARLYEQSLSFDVYPAASLEGSLYLDDGESLSHRDGEFALVSISGRHAGGKVSLALEQADGRMSRMKPPLARFARVLVRIARYGKAALSGRVTVNGRPLPEEHVATRGDWIEISLPEPEVPLAVEAELP